MAKSPQAPKLNQTKTNSLFVFFLNYYFLQREKMVEFDRLEIFSD